MPTVPCPAITNGSSNGWMKFTLFFLQNVFDSFSASSKLLPIKTTLAFKSLTAFTLIKGVVFGMKIVALMPSSFAE